MEQLFATYGIPFIILYVVITAFSIRIFNTVFHEAGHAIAMVLLTGQNVVVYLGSYGDQQKSTRVKFGRFEVWLRKNPFAWNGGLCVLQASAVTDRQRIAYIAAGPAATLLLAISFLILFLYYPHEGLWAPFLLIASIANWLSFLYNTVPGYAAILTGSGSLTYNDGAQLKAIWDKKRLPQEYTLAQSYINEGKLKEGAEQLDAIIRSGSRKPEVYRLAIETNIRLKNYAKAEALQKQQIAKIGNINSHDRINLALLKTLTGKYDEAISYYRHLLQTGGNNKFNLNNFGYTLTLVDRCEEAIPYFDKAIAADSNWAEPLNNRGYARMKCGLIEDGRFDVEHSLQLDPSNAYAYRNLGIYYYDRGGYRDALTQFEKAREIDPDIPQLNKYYLDTHYRLNDQ